MGGKRISIVISDEQFKVLEGMAEEQGLRATAFVKSELVKTILANGTASGERKRILVDITNYSDLSGYVEQKHFGSIASFATFAMESVMQRNPLTEAQKARFGKSIK
ncbi:MAG: hypothetical protein IJ158_09185 [Treponema sp.]|nr:hypothetical protein [Treponema sp.]